MYSLMDISLDTFPYSGRVESKVLLPLAFVSSPACVPAGQLLGGHTCKLCEGLLHASVHKVQQ